MATGYFPALMVLNLSHVTNCVKQATLVTQLSHVNAQVTSDICGVPRGGLLIFWPKAASYPDVSLRCARKGRREGDNVCRLYPSHGPLRFITSHSRFALASAMRKKKGLRRRLRQKCMGWCYWLERVVLQ